MSIALIANLAASLDALSPVRPAPQTAGARTSEKPLDSRADRADRPDRSADSVSISAEGLRASRATPSADAQSAGDDELSQEERSQVEELSARDAEVRAHEQAHAAAAGALLRGGPNYNYTQGPDGKRYATSGDVQIDTSKGGTPEETIAKAQQVRASALAPAEPSSTDLSVAANAARMEAEARAELAEQRAEKASGADEEGESDSIEPGAAAQSSNGGARTPVEQLKIDVYA